VASLRQVPVPHPPAIILVKSCAQQLPRPIVYQ
jgi:hypothetical protein